MIRKLEKEYAPISAVKTVIKVLFSNIIEVKDNKFYCKPEALRDALFIGEYKDSELKFELYPEGIFGFVVDSKNMRVYEIIKTGSFDAKKDLGLETIEKIPINAMKAVLPNGLCSYCFVKDGVEYVTSYIAPNHSGDIHVIAKHRITRSIPK